MEKQIKNSFRIYPNPTGDIINIENSLILNYVTIYDIVGREIISLKGNVLNIDVSSLKSGTYLLKAETNNEIITKSFIKK